jgi:hypothetical protein
LEFAFGWHLGAVILVEGLDEEAVFRLTGDNGRSRIAPREDRGA